MDRPTIQNSKARKKTISGKSVTTTLFDSSKNVIAVSDKI